MTQHTPTPWREYKDGIHPILTDGIEKNAHHAICAEFFGPDAVLNRAFVIRACNAHDDLVAALNVAYTCLEDCYTKSAIESDPKFEAMRKIIAREKLK